MTPLEVHGVGHAFGRTKVLDDVSFAVPAAGFVVLLGPNGAGKTTLFSLITGLYHARVGRIAIFGHAVRRDPVNALAAAGVVFQLTTLDLDLTVRQNLRYAAALHGLTRADADARMAEELGRLNLAGLLPRTVRTLSGGEKRSVEIARALLHRPRLLLLDEPTTGLDPRARATILAHVRALCRERGLAALWATHLLDELEPSDSVIMLEKGRVVRHGRAEALGIAARPAFSLA